MSTASSPGRVLRNLDRVLNNPAQLRVPERLMLYSLVTAWKPRFALEIGSAEGGSALLTCGAMDDNGLGRLVCVDPAFRFSDAIWESVKHRVTRVQGYSPQALPEAASAIAPERFDFAFIDGDHTFEGVQRDVEGVLGLLADNAVLLFHDSHHPPVRAGIDDIIARSGGELTDLGELSVEQTVLETADGCEIWGGMRGARFTRGSAARTAATAAAPVDENTRAAMNTLIRRGSERIAELEQENRRLWSDLQKIRTGFDERGAVVQDLEGRFRKLWDEMKTASGNYEAEIRRLQSEQSALATGFDERGRRVGELETHNRKLSDETKRIAADLISRGERIRELELELARGRSATAGRSR